MKKIIQLFALFISMSLFITLLFYNEIDLLKYRNISQYLLGSHSFDDYTDFYVEINPKNFNHKFLDISNFSEFNEKKCFYSFTISEIYEPTFLDYGENDFNVSFRLNCNDDAIVKLDKILSIPNLDRNLINKQKLSLSYSFDYKTYLIRKDVLKKYSKNHFQDILNSEVLDSFYNDVASEIKLYIDNKNLGIENELTWISV